MEDRVLPHLRPALRAQLAGDSSDDAAIDPADAAAPNQLDAVRQACARGKLKRVGKILRGTHPAKVAGLLEALPPRERSAVWSMVDVERSGKVLRLPARRDPQRAGHRAGARRPAGGRAAAGAGRPGRPDPGAAARGGGAVAERQHRPPPPAAGVDAALPGGRGRRPDEHRRDRGSGQRQGEHRAALPAATARPCRRRPTC